MELTEHITDRISSDGGGALIIDYGKDGIVSDSLQVWILISFLYA
jgi:NADH dehydrogenase [ubiquinone] 1 alpha subcomplex assembly factor 7